MMTKLIIWCMCGKNFDKPLAAENHKKKHPTHMQTIETEFQVIGDYWPFEVLPTTEGTKS